MHFTCQVTGVDNWDLGSVLGFPEYMNGIWYLSLLTVGAAFIAGKGGVAFIIGGFACYWVIAPLLAVSGLLPVDMTAGHPVTVTDPEHLRAHITRALRDNPDEVKRLFLAWVDSEKERA